MDVSGRSAFFRADERSRYGREGVWSWPPDAEAKLVGMMISRATGARKPGSRGERAISVKTIAQGGPGCFGQTCGDCRLLFVLQAGHGRGQRPAFPAPSSIFEGDVFAKPGRDRAAGQQTRISPLFDS